MNTRKLTTLTNALKLIGCLSTLNGYAAAAPLVLNVEDVVVIPGKKTQFSAWLAQGHSMAFKRDIKNAVIHFCVNGNEVAQATTDRDGQAVISCELSPTKANTFQAKTQVGKSTVEASGTIYHWSNDKTIVAVDIDDTISDTNYSDLFISNLDKTSKPIGNSRDVLEKMAKDYQIFYFSARPRFFYEKTKQWLQDNRFPMGPIAHAAKFEACLRQTTYKRRMLADLRSRYPNMLIGIGDRNVDDRAFNASNMLTVLVNPNKLDAFSTRCVMCTDWNHVDRFFSTYRRDLSNPQKLLAVIDQKTELGTPVLIGEPTGPRASLK